MSGILSSFALTSLRQKALLIGLGGALAVAGAFNVKQAIENRSLSRQNVAFEARINDPKTGYVVKLAQATTNTETCAAAIGRQNAAIRDVAQRDAVTAAAVQRRYDAEHANRLRAERAAAAFLAREPEGETVAERVADVDAQILGDLK